jgi:hypothetical protein
LPHANRDDLAAAGDCNEGPRLVLGHIENNLAGLQRDAPHPIVVLQAAQNVPGEALLRPPQRLER